MELKSSIAQGHVEIAVNAYSTDRKVIRFSIARRGNDPDLVHVIGPGWADTYSFDELEKRLKP